MGKAAARVVLDSEALRTERLLHRKGLPDANSRTPSTSPITDHGIFVFHRVSSNSLRSEFRSGFAGNPGADMESSLPFRSRRLVAVALTLREYPDRSMILLN